MGANVYNNFVETSIVIMNNNFSPFSFWILFFCTLLLTSQLLKFLTSYTCNNSGTRVNLQSRKMTCFSRINKYNRTLKLKEKNRCIHIEYNAWRHQTAIQRSIIIIQLFYNDLHLQWPKIHAYKANPETALSIFGASLVSFNNLQC